MPTLDQTLVRLREGKRKLRRARRNMNLTEKVRLVVELQKAVLPMIRRRRALRPWEHVWKLEGR